MSETIETAGSSHIARVTWIDEVGPPAQMIVEFQDGSEYAYSCPKAVFEGFRSAGSAGSYFHRHVKSRYSGVPV